MSDSTKRHARWRRTVAAGFVASLALHATALALVHLDGGIVGGEDAREARADERAERWDRDAMRMVQVREVRSDRDELAPRPPIRGGEAAAHATSGEGEGPAAMYGPAGSSLASAAFASLERTAAAPASRDADEEGAPARVEDGARVVMSTGQPASVRPRPARRGPVTYRPASSAARTATRDGEAPGLGDSARVVDDRGRSAGRDDDRRAGGVTVRGGSCGTIGGAIIDRVIPRGSLIGG